MEKSVSDHPDAPAWVRSLLLLLIPFIGLALYLEGQDYNPGLVELKPGTDASDAVTLLPESLGGLERANPVRSFNKDSLYEYINGHADYFISGGFRLLAVGEYGADSAGQPSLVVNLYDMGQPLHAFGVMMGETGEDLAPVDLGSLGFRGGQQIKFVYGPYYAQLSAFGERIPLNDAGVDLARLLSERRSEVKPLDLRFPDLGEPVETQFIKEDYRGLDFLDNVLERRFLRRDGELTAFQVNASESEIGELTNRLKKFLDEEGIAFDSKQDLGLDFFHVRDPYEGEWIFVPLGTRLLGIFGRPDTALLKDISASRQEK